MLVNVRLAFRRRLVGLGRTITEGRIGDEDLEVADNEKNDGCGRKSQPCAREDSVTPFACPAPRYEKFLSPSQFAPAILWASLMAFLPLAAIANAWAAPATVADIATYDGSDRQAVLEAGAKREGALLLYTTGTQTQPLMDRFRQKYPYIKLEVLRADTSDISRRVIEEYAAGLYQADGFELGSVGLVLPREQGLLQPFFSPEALNYDPQSIEPQKRWISVRESYAGIGYNTDLISPGQAPKTWEDLADPRFKNKLAISGSPSITAEWTAILVQEYGRDILQRIAAQNMRIYDITSRALANLTVSGEVSVLARASNAHFIDSQNHGAHVAWVAPGPVAAEDVDVAITIRAPHPYSMMLMIDFLLSREAQQIYGELGYDSARRDLRSPDAPAQKIYFAQHPNFFAEFEESSRLFDATFARNH
jgi:iron(III) transport system substrate-binding protein